MLIRAANGAVPAVWLEIPKSSADHRPVATDFAAYRAHYGLYCGKRQLMIASGRSRMHHALTYVCVCVWVHTCGRF